MSVRTKARIRVSTVVAPALVGVLAGLAFQMAPAQASEVGFFRVQSRADFLAGTLDRISVDPLGNLRLADRGRRVSELTEPFLFSGASYPGGWVLGTGNSGTVFRIGTDGTTSELFSADEPEIFAVWADRDGTVFAGSSPNGKVYRIAGDEVSVFFDPEETYIWDLTRAADGSLWVATGTEGRLYRVDADGNGELLFDSDDTHLRALQLLPDGDVLVGTAGDGLILRVSPDGRARTLYDADQPEVVDFTVGPDGEAYASILASEASLMDLSRRSGQPNNGNQGAQQQGGNGGGNVTVTVGPAAGQAEEASGSRPRNFQGPRAEVVQISPDGMVKSIQQFEEETVYAVHWQRERLWIATGLDGKLYSLKSGQLVLEKDVEERQLVVLLDDQPGPAFASTNAAAFYRISNEAEAAGSYTSAALDALQTSRFGSLRWRGDLAGGGVRVSARSGASSNPDRTWSEWTKPKSGSEIPLAEVPPGRYLQWKAEMTADQGRTPVLGSVDVSYEQLNLPPRIQSLRVLGPGEIVVAAGFNPNNQVYEPAHPNRQGIFTPLEPARVREDRRQKTLWKKGYRSLQWEAEDPNEDDLSYELFFQPEGAGDSWLPMADEIDADFYSFDATALPDGFYRFRLRALDRPADGLDAPLAAEEISDSVLVDHSRPELAEARREGGRFRLVAVDSLSPLRGAEVSFDAEQWRPLRPEDGLLDGKRETLSVDAPAEASMVLLRLTDAAFNVVTFDLLQEAR